MTTLFVTGTGTGVGKTYCTVQLVRAARARRLRVSALKPVVSGYDPATPQGSDTAQLLGALGDTLDAANVDRVSPWRFREPLSPDMAARREGRTVPFEALVAYCRAASAAPAELTLIEGVGGVMVPLDDTHTVVDWIAALGAPAVLVAGSYLGTLSHTLTAVAVLRARGCEIAAVVVAESPEEPVSSDATAQTLARHLRPLRVAVVPRGATHESVEIFSTLVATHGRG
jgi:dethiobiotin synthetase